MCCIACASHDQQGHPVQPETPLDVSIEEFNQAFRQFDVDLLSRSITAGYQHTIGSAAPLSKDSWLNYLRAEKKHVEAGTLTYHTIVMEESTVDYYADAAFITGRVVLTGQRDGERIDQAYRTSQMWVIEDGRWKRAGYHETRIR
jgi:hypothetical protein